MNRFILAAGVLPFFMSCAGLATSAEEYYAIGMAYFEMGRYDEAERWLNRALSRSRTMSASEYNLGRIAYGTGRYSEALRKFKAILKKDPENIMALKAAAYTQVKLGNLDEAQKLYDKVLQLEPSEADSALNYATILFAMDKPKEAEEALLKYDYAIFDDKDALLLLARLQRAQKKPEAIDNYDRWLSKNNDPQVRYEFADVLEAGGFYVRALEAARKILTELTADTETLKIPAIHFLIARLIFVSDSENPEAVTELTAAIRGGFDDKETIDALLNDERLARSVRDEVSRTIDAAKTTPAEGAASTESGTPAASTEGGPSATESGSSASTSTNPGEPAAGGGS
ncbi:MAG: tetratricopeptide repeat protein [Spirochaetaceae bacterium]|jgi:tetratricopeptide (TPR) repeat protein|nr:tetratricopeptide repeat protein [Spirochaetaceae bacterium]